MLAATSGTVDQSSPAAKAEAPTVLRDDRTGSNAPSETARKETVNTAEVTELSGDEQPTRIEREIAVCKRFDVPPEKGLNREEASRAFSDNGINLVRADHGLSMVGSFARTTGDGYQIRAVIGSAIRPPRHPDLG